MAKTDLETLVISLEANIKKYEAELKRGQQVTLSALGKIERDATSKIKGIEKTFGRLSKEIIATAGLSVGVAQLGRSLFTAAQSFQSMQNALKVTGLEGKSLDTVFKALYDSAQRHSAPVEALVRLYSRAALAQRELGATSGELTTFSDGVAVALKVAGTSATEASGALTQLGQLLGSARVQAEEFNSLVDGAPTILRAAAIGIEEAGGSVSKLKQLVNDGQISNQAFFRGFLAGVPALQDQADKMGDTVQMAWNRISNAFAAFSGELDKTTDASKVITGEMNSIATAITALPAVLDNAARAFRDLKADAEGLADAMGLDQIQQFIKQAHESIGTESLWDSIHSATGGRSKRLFESLGLYTNYDKALEAREGFYGPMLPSGWTPRADREAALNAVTPPASAKVQTIKAKDFAGPLSGGSEEAIASAIKKGFLDLVGYAEGTDKGRGYNETLGYGKFSGGDKNLVMMTIGQVKELQGNMLAHPDNNFNSSAVGRYQITKRTLTDLQSRLGVSDEEYFDAAMQDRLAQELMRRRGNNPAALRNEWEGLRKVDDASIRAAYDGTSVDMPAADQSLSDAKKKADELVASYQQIIVGARQFISEQEMERVAVGLTAEQAAKLRYEHEMLNQAQEAGIALSPQQREEIGKLAQGMAQAEQATNRYAETQEQLADTARFFGSEAVDAVSGLVTGTTTAEQALQSLIQTLMRATLQAALLGEGPLASLFGGNGGGLTKSIGSALGSLFGGGSGAGAGFTGTGIYHNGGLVGAGGASRTVPAALFAGAPRYHNGGVAGLKPDEIPAILQRGEYVVSKANMAAAAVASRGGGGAAPTVNVINNGPTQPEVQASRSGDGWSIDVMIPALENAMAARAGRGHGSLGKAVTSTATGRNLRG